MGRRRGSDELQNQGDPKRYRDVRQTYALLLICSFFLAGSMGR